MYVCEKSTNLELQFELVFHALVVVPTCPFPKRPSRIRFDRKPIIIIGFIVLYVLDKRLIFGLQTFRPLGRSRTCLSKNNSSKRNKSSFQFLVPVLLLYVPAFKDRRGIFWSAAFVLESIPLFVFFDMILSRILLVLDDWWRIWRNETVVCVKTDRRRNEKKRRSKIIQASTEVQEKIKRCTVQMD